MEATLSARISKDTRLCISLAARPSNFGTRFHNYLYEALGLDYVYKAMTTRELPAAIGGVRALGIRGCAVSMPFKESCIPLLDELDTSAARLRSVNTIINDEGHLSGYNTDWMAVCKLLAQHGVPRESRFALRGNGGMARAVLGALNHMGFHDGVVVARNERIGSALASRWGVRWQPELDGVRAGFLINATPIGMAGGPEAETLAFTPEQIDGSHTVFDVVATPIDTPLVRAARERAKSIISGAEVAALQAAEQFALYTGVRPSEDLVRKAAEWARG